MPSSSAISKTIRIYFPLINLDTSIVDGKLHTSANINMAPAKVDNFGTENEKWTALVSLPAPNTCPIADKNSSVVNISIPDVINLDSDIVSLTPQIVTLYTNIVTLVAYINTMRQIL